MRRKRNNQLIIIGILVFAIIFMSVGFAAYSQTLNIQGTATVGVVEWDIHWKDESFDQQDDSVEVEAELDEDNTNLSFSGTLAEPGDQIHFKITAINAGDFDAHLQKVTMTPLTTAQAKYLTFTVKFGNKTYTQTTDNITTTLLRSAEKDAEVIVTYIQPDSPNDLPTEEVDVDFDINFDFEQNTN